MMTRIWWYFQAAKRAAYWKFQAEISATVLANLSDRLNRISTTLEELEKQNRALKKENEELKRYLYSSPHN